MRMEKRARLVAAVVCPVWCGKCLGLLAEHLEFEEGFVILTMFAVAFSLHWVLLVVDSWCDDTGSTRPGRL